MNETQESEVKLLPPLTGAQLAFFVRRRHESLFFDGKLQAIYVILSADLVKIGISRNPLKRLSSLRTGNGNKLALVAQCSGVLADERRLHRFFREERVEGEWFRLSPRLKYLVAWISENKRVPTQEEMDAIEQFALDPSQVVPWPPRIIVPLLARFLASSVVRLGAPEDESPIHAMFLAYKAWAVNEGIVPLLETKFERAMEHHGFKTQPTRLGLFYFGIEIVGIASATPATGFYHEDILGDFLASAKHVIRRESDNCPSRSLYKAYLRWATDEKAEPVSEVKFGLTMAATGFAKKKKKSGNFWQGISVVDVDVQVEMI